jgi:hypothetical protein
MFLSNQSVVVKKLFIGYEMIGMVVEFESIIESRFPSHIRTMMPLQSLYTVNLHFWLILLIRPVVELEIITRVTARDAWVLSSVPKVASHQTHIK